MPKSGESLFTLQSRRIFLKRADDAVTGYVVVGGDHFPQEDAFNEPMTLWRVKKEKPKDFHVPKKEQNSSKQFWRDFTALLAESAGGNEGESTSKVQAARPGILKWLDSLILKDAITPRNVKICTLNVLYGSQSSGIKEIWGDSVSVNSGIISSLHVDWQSRIAEILELTDKLAGCVGFLIADLELCKGLDEGEKKKNYYNISNEAKEEPYLQLDNPFRTWLAGIDPANIDPDYKDEVMKQWVGIAKELVLKIGKEFVAQVGTQAFIGIKEMNAVKAYRKFRYSISVALKGGFR